MDLNIKAKTIKAFKGKKKTIGNRQMFLRQDTENNSYGKNSQGKIW